jgi:hypothetical protein
MFYFQNLCKNLQLTWLKEEGDLFQAIPFFNYPKIHGRHIESCSVGIARNGLCWCLVQKLCLQ